MFIIHTRYFAYKMFWPKSISLEQDHTVHSESSIYTQIHQLIRLFTSKT